MRLDKFLVSQGINSRKECQSLIKKKKVTVNDKIITEVNYDVNEELDKIICSDNLIIYKSDIYIVLHKPAGYVCATIDNYQKTVLTLIKEKYPLVIVGRLDKDTEGLLLLTTDGAFVHELTSPKHLCDKEYYIEYTGEMTKEKRELLETGVKIDNDYLTKPAKLTIVDGKTYLTIQEGKFHQVKKMFQAIDLYVTYLKRVRIGGLTLKADLPVGAYYYLTKEEIKKYFNYEKNKSNDK